MTYAWGGVFGRGGGAGSGKIKIQTLGFDVAKHIMSESEPSSCKNVI